VRAWILEVVILGFLRCGETHASTFPATGNSGGDAPSPLNYSLENSIGRDMAVIRSVTQRNRARPADRRCAALSLLRRVLFHDRDIAVGLVGDHLPASHQARQNRRLGSALRDKHETVTFLGLGPAPAGFVDLPLGAKKAQRRPARYTSPGKTKPRGRPVQCRSIAAATSAGVERLNARFETSCTLRQRREHNTLCHRIRAYGQAVMASNQPRILKVVCSILYTNENIAPAARRRSTRVAGDYRSSEMTLLQT
jgi:hypothetical protein